MPRDHPTPAPDRPARRRAAEAKDGRMHNELLTVQPSGSARSGVTLLVHLLSSLFVHLHFVWAWRPVCGKLRTKFIGTKENVSDFGTKALLRAECNDKFRALVHERGMHWAKVAI